MTLRATPTGLQIFMNGINSNALIGIDTSVDFGSYEIVVGAPGHKPWRQTIEVKEEGKVTAVLIELQPVAP